VPLACSVIAALVFASIGTVLPTTAGAYAMAGAAPIAGPAGLPDGRVFEEVSPADKDGNAVRNEDLGLAAEDGDAVVYVGTGGMGAASGGLTEVFVSRRSVSGWTTSSTRPLQLGEVKIFGGRPLTLVPSADFSRFLFTTFGSYVLAEPHQYYSESSANVFLSSDPTVEPSWIAQPTIADPIPALGHNTSIRDYLVVGGTPDFGTVYFTYSGTLIPQDASRAPNVGTGTLQQGEVTPDKQKDDPWGFYEWNNGKLDAAGVLPDGTLDPYGAVPAAIAGQGDFERAIAPPNELPQTLDNEISADGSRAFFVSPDPVASTVTDPVGCMEEPSCTNAPPELYVRETAPDGAKSTVLVSQSELPEDLGEPAPNGPASVENAPIANANRDGSSYVYASPDGSQAFFASADSLAEGAEGTGVKEYDFNIDTGKLTYLPGVVGPIVASSPDGADFIFENTTTTPAELDLWQGPGSGQITPIEQLPPPPSLEGGGENKLDVSGGRASADGSVFVFRTNSPVAGFNDAGGFEQVYRYSVDTSEVICVSCPPAGSIPVGEEGEEAQLSGARVSENDTESGEPLTTLDTRVISSDGSRIFFDTPEPLVPQDVNGKRDVYEWENGHIFLISSGESTENSYLLDSSANGDDVFFKTTSGLVPGDFDETNDVYDARVPRPGDSSPPAAVPCEGDVCQGPSQLPSLVGPPASATFSGAGNLAVPATKPAAHKPLTRAQELAKALKACRAKRNKRKRHSCEDQAKKAGSRPKAKKTIRKAK
jgi:hypothetical protein